MLFLTDVDHVSFEKANETRQNNLQSATVSLQRANTMETCFTFFKKVNYQETPRACSAEREKQYLVGSCYR